MMPKSYKLFALFFYFLIYCYLPQSQASNKTIGQATLVRGTVYRVPHGTINKEIVSEGAAIAMGDHLETMASSLVKVTLLDGSSMAFAPNSKFHFRTFTYKKGFERKANMQLLIGQMRANFVKEKLKKGSNITLGTKAVSMGVRGTEVLLNALERGGKSYAQAALISGQAIIVDHTRKNSVIKLTPGASYVAHLGSEHSAPNSYKVPLGERTHQALASSNMDSMVRPSLDASSEDFALASDQDSGAAPSVDEMAKGLFLDPDFGLKESKR